MGEVFTKSKERALALTSAHIVGDVKMGTGEMRLDIAGQTDGSNQKLVLTHPDFGTIELLTVASKMYMKADTKFWESQAPGMGALFTGKYVLVPASKTGGMSDIKIEGLMKQVYEGPSAMSMSAKTTPVGETEVSGTKAYVITEGPGEAEMIVTADGQANLIEWRGTPKEPGMIRFSELDSVSPFSAPSDSEVVAFPEK